MPDPEVVLLAARPGCSRGSKAESQPEEEGIVSLGAVRVVRIARVVEL